MAELEEFMDKCIKLEADNVELKQNIKKLSELIDVADEMVVDKNTRIEELKCEIAFLKSLIKEQEMENNE